MSTKDIDRLAPEPLQSYSFEAMIDAAQTQINAESAVKLKEAKQDSYGSVHVANTRYEFKSADRGLEVQAYNDKNEPLFAEPKHIETSKPAALAAGMTAIMQDTYDSHVSFLNSGRATALIKQSSEIAQIGMNLVGKPDNAFEAAMGMRAALARILPQADVTMAIGRDPMAAVKALAGIADAVADDRITAEKASHVSTSPNDPNLLGKVLEETASRQRSAFKRNPDANALDNDSKAQLDARTYEGLKNADHIEMKVSLKGKGSEPFILRINKDGSGFSFDAQTAGHERLAGDRRDIKGTLNWLDANGRNSGPTQALLKSLEGLTGAKSINGAIPDTLAKAAHTASKSPLVKQQSVVSTKLHEDGIAMPKEMLEAAMRHRDAEALNSAIKATVQRPSLPTGPGR